MDILENSTIDEATDLASVEDTPHNLPQLSDRNVGSTSKDLVFVNSDVENYTSLVNSIKVDFDVFVLDSQADGIEQINRVLAEYEEVDSIQVFSHGESGSLELGSTSLSLDNLPLYRDRLSAWSEILGDEADVLLYACEVGKDEIGQNLIDRLANLTDADFAVSTDLTGSSVLGGDWELEYQTGTIETSLAIGTEAQLEFDSILANDWVIETDPDFQSEQLLSGLAEPIDLAELPDGRLLIIQKGGEIQITDPTVDNPTTDSYMNISDLNDGGERGLISIALDPDFASNNYFYVYYAKNSTQRFRISRFTHNGNSADLSSEFVVWEDNENFSSNAHYGGGLGFGPDGKIYLSTADEFDRAQSADLTRAGGKIIRVNKDGSIPTDNPFVDGVGGNLDEIWAYGLRNPWRAFWDLPTERFFINEVGGNDPLTAREDVHLGEAGANYGWPQYEGISNDPAVNDPIFTYDHSESDRGSGAISGGIVYRGNNLPSQYNGVYFFGDYSQSWIRYLAFDDNGDVIDAEPSTPNTIEAFNFNQNAGRVVAFEEAKDGSLYYLDIYQNPTDLGQLRRITYNGEDGDNQSPIIEEAIADTTIGGEPLTVNFSSSATDPENDPLNYLWDFGDGNQSTGANVTHTFESNGLYDVSLTVSDNINSVTLDSPIEITVGTAPEATIISPLNNSDFRGGDLITLEGSATDADGTLGEQNYEWTVLLNQRGATQPRETGTGTSFDIRIPTGDTLDFSGDKFYEVILKVTDADGLSDVEQIAIYPEESDLTFDSNIPGGVTFTFDDVPKTGPFVYDSAINWEHVVSAPETVNSGGLLYSFDSWSDGTTNNTRSIIVPESDRTYTANYTVSGESTALPITEGLVLQLDAELGVSTDSNGVVTEWADQSGQGNDLTGFGDPTLISGGLNGNDVISLDGEGDKLQRTLTLNGLPAGNSDRTVLMVAKYDSTGYGGFAYGRGFNSRTFGLIVAGDGDLGVQAWGIGDANTNVDGTGAGWLTQSAILAQSNLTHYKDGELIGSKTHNYNTTLNRIVLGAEIDSNPYVDMEVAEILVYDEALSEGELQQVENYLQQKYFGATPPNNQAPTVKDDELLTDNNTVLNGNLLSDNGNGADLDPDGDSLTITQVNGNSAAIGTQIVLNSNALLTVEEDGSFSYDPNSQFDSLAPGESRVDSFTYSISDGNGGSDTGTVTLTINGIGDPTENQAPTAQDDALATSNNTVLNGNLLSDNGNGADLDPDGDSLTITQVNGDSAVIGTQISLDSNALLTVAEDGSFSYDPNSQFDSLAAGESRVDSFTYSISDGNGGSDTGTVTLTINGITDSTGGGDNTLPITEGLVLQLDAELGVSTDSDGVVTEWADQSGQGNDLTGFGDPTLISGGLNGNDVISLDGEGDKLQRTLTLNGLPAGNSDRTVLMVAKYDSTGYGGFAYGRGFNSRTFGLIVAGDGDLGVQAWGIGDANTNVDGTGAGWLTHSAILAQSNLTHYKDGELIGSKTHNYNTTLNRIVLGAEIDSNPYIDMEVAEILVYDEALSEAEHQQVENYLQQKYFGNT